MWTKIYLAAIVLSAAVCGFFNYYAWSWLQSKGNPADAISGFEYHFGISWMTIWITTLVLLILANAVLWATTRAWAMWATFLYFAVLMVMRYFWLGREILDFQKARGFSDDGFSVAPLFGAMFIMLMAVVVFLDQFVVVRLNRKMYPAAAVPEIEAETQVVEEKSGE